MPLKKGQSRSVVSANVGEMVRSYKRTGKIGSTRPRSVAHAQKIASAAAHSKARGGRKQKRKKRQ